MTDKYSNFELDDELLSAYIDGELNADDRAAVEARLAADPAAQQLLHELRTVAQDVQSLPTVRVGRDLSEDILRRVSAKKSAAAQAEPSPSAGPMPKITIFSTKRSWMWASLALAAGLLLMVVQSGDERGNRLAPQAKLADKKPANELVREAEKSTRRGSALELSQLKRDDSGISNNEPAAASSTLPDASVPPLEQLAESTPQRAPAGVPTSGVAPSIVADGTHHYADSESAAKPATDGKELVDSLSAVPQPAPAAASVEGTVSLSARGGEGKLESSQSEAEQDQLVVVRVVAKREALQNKVFDQLLASQKIDVEPQQAKDQRVNLDRSSPKQVEGRQGGQSDKSFAGKETDVVLVEAPEHTIESFLDVMNKDSVNFVGIDVDDTNQSRDLAAFKAPVKSKSSENLSRFARGAVPQQKNGVADRHEYFLGKPATNTNDDVAGFSGGPGGAPGGAAGRLGAGALAKQKSLGPESADEKSQVSRALGRARRIQTWDSDAPLFEKQSQRNRSFGGKQIEEAKKTPAPVRALKEHEKSTKSGAANLRVLFLFSPEDAATPSAPPADPTK